jgi:hypothetical protein
VTYCSGLPHKEQQLVNRPKWHLSLRRQHLKLARDKTKAHPQRLAYSAVFE